MLHTVPFDEGQGVGMTLQSFGKLGAQKCYSQVQICVDILMCEAADQQPKVGASMLKSQAVQHAVDCRGVQTSGTLALEASSTCGHSQRS